MLIIPEMIRRRISLLFFILSPFFCFPAAAQRFELGAGIGYLSYRGDLQPKYWPTHPGVAAELIGRYNLSMAAVLRANLLYSPSLSASSADSPDPFVRTEKPSTGFSGYLAELGVFGEYNFFNYRNPKNRHVFGSPYLFGGPCLAITKRGPADNFSPDSIFDLHGQYFVFRREEAKLALFPGFVLGVGYKQQLGQYFNLGVQASGRFLLFDGDKFDQVSDREIRRVAVLDEAGNFIPDGNGGFQYKSASGPQLGNVPDRDSYFFLGISLTYTIKEVICPFKYEKKPDK